MTARKTCVSLLLDSASIPSRRNPRESAIARSVEDFRNIVLYRGKFFDWVLFFSGLSFAFHPIKDVLTFFSPFGRGMGGGGRWGRRSLSRLLKSKMAAVLHRNSMDRDDEYHSQLRLIKRIIKNNTIYYIKVSGIPSGNKSIKMIYPHMWRYDILT